MHLAKTDWNITLAYTLIIGPLSWIATMLIYRTIEVSSVYSCALAIINTGSCYLYGTLKNNCDHHLW